MKEQVLDLFRRLDERNSKKEPTFCTRTNNRTQKRREPSRDLRRLEWSVNYEKEQNKPVLNGGLDLRSLVEKNKVMQGKWLWRFMNEDIVLWRRVIAVKFGIDERGWFTKGVTRDLMGRLRKKIGEGRDGFQEFVRWMAGKGDRVRPWEDKWLESVTSMISTLRSMLYPRKGCKDL